MIGNSPNNSGHLGYLAEIAADEGMDADPDRITAGVKYRGVLDPRTRGVILQVQPVAGEFGRKAPRTTTMLTTAQVEHVLVPDDWLGQSTMGSGCAGRD